VTAFYAWSGSLHTLKGTPVFEPFTVSNGTWLATPGVAVFMLPLHASAGLALDDLRCAPKPMKAGRR